MNLWEGFRVALAGLLANRLRAVLTMLGIVIGVTAVISLISLGHGVEGYISNQFEKMGTNLLVVIPQQPTSPTRTRIQSLTTKEASDLLDPSIAPSVVDVAMDYRINSSKVEGGGELMNTTVVGASPNLISVRTWEVRDGSFITQADLDDTARVAVLGVNVVDELYGSKDYNPVGQSIRLNQRTFTVIGVMTELGSSFTADDDYVFIPLTTAQTRMSHARARDGSYDVTAMWVSAGSKESMTAATREIETYLRQAHNVVFDGEQDFTIANQADILNSVGAITGLLTAVLGLIASISLLVGGIGIMNIMLVSVTERTREIGLRKAVGARGRDVLTQFLIESIVLSVLGGAIGILLGYLATQGVMAAVPDLHVGLTVDAVVLATSVSTFVGVFFGLYPANRAARMRPIDALRFE